METKEGGRKYMEKGKVGKEKDMDGSAEPDCGKRGRLWHVWRRKVHKQWGASKTTKSGVADVFWF